jgi:hypothetical protein
MAFQGAQRGALLVHRLLAFSRTQRLQPRTLSVNTLVTGASDMLRRTIAETIQIETVLGAVFGRSPSIRRSLKVRCSTSPSTHEMQCPMADD